MEFTLYTAAVTGAEANCRYPEQRKIGCAEALKPAAGLNQVGLASKKISGNGRNFLSLHFLALNGVIQIRKILVD